MYWPTFFWMGLYSSDTLTVVVPLGERGGAMSTEAWVSVDAVAKHLSVAKDSIYRWIEHKRLPAHRVGRLWKFKLSQIDEWVRAGGATSAAVAPQPPSLEQIRDRLDTMLSAAFEGEPVEDGVAHPAEYILERALHTGDQSTMLGIVAALCSDTARPGFSAATLRCLGRLTPPGSSAWRSAVVRGALAHSEVELRDAAVQAVESWGDRNLIDVLRAHREAEAWLAEYIMEVTGAAGRRASARRCGRAGRELVGLGRLHRRGNLPAPRQRGMGLPVRVPGRGCGCATATCSWARSAANLWQPICCAAFPG